MDNTEDRSRAKRFLGELARATKKHRRIPPRGAPPLDPRMVQKKISTEVMSSRTEAQLRGELQALKRQSADAMRLAREAAAEVAANKEEQKHLEQYLRETITKLESEVAAQSDRIQQLEKQQTADNQAFYFKCFAAAVLVGLGAWLISRTVENDDDEDD